MLDFTGGVAPQAGNLTPGSPHTCWITIWSLSQANWPCNERSTAGKQALISGAPQPCDWHAVPVYSGASHQQQAGQAWSKCGYTSDPAPAHNHRHPRRELAEMITGHFSRVCSALRAGVLTSSLREEAVRWKALATQKDDEIGRLVGDALLSAACISYLGPFTGPFRAQLLDRWRTECKALDIPVSPTFSLQQTLTTPMEIRSWQSQVRAILPA